MYEIMILNIWYEVSECFVFFPPFLSSKQEINTGNRKLSCESYGEWNEFRVLIPSLTNSLTRWLGVLQYVKKRRLSQICSNAFWVICGQWCRLNLSCNVRALRRMNPRGSGRGDEGMRGRGDEGVSGAGLEHRDHFLAAGWRISDRKIKEERKRGGVYYQFKLQPLPERFP